MNVAYLSLGSNLGDRAANLRAAIAELSGLGDLTKRSSFYETEPMEVRDQPWFLNCAVELKTVLEPQELLESILAIEERLGRTREVPKGPRTVDIDLLLFNHRVLHESATLKFDGLSHHLEVPHPAMHRRRFVLQPLAEIAPESRNPVSGKTARELLQELPMDTGMVRRLAS